MGDLRSLVGVVCSQSLFEARLLCSLVWSWNLYAQSFHRLFAVDPETEETTLPVKESTEYRPFTRKLPEFKFWWSGARATAIALGMTFIPFFDLPVYWPILLAYFILLLVLTMKDRVKHMIKHKYVPFNFGKQTYGELSKVKVPGEKNDK
eukprot:symbB.v1.2.036577.t1/scaffold5196.1/size29908/6